MMVLKSTDDWVHYSSGIHMELVMVNTKEEEIHIIGSYDPHPPSPHLLVLSPRADIHFTVPRRVKG